MSIIGHQKIINLLDRAIAKDAVSHAYLFSGPEHVGKFTVAMEFAKKLSGSGEAINSDLIVVSPETEEIRGVIKMRDIKIEQIRELQRQLGLSAQFGKYKAAVIDEADRLNKAAQNALLKTLEEAESGVTVILVVQDEARILPTIFSRCQKIKFGTVPDAELMRKLGERTDAEKIIFWSLGRPGLMLKLITDKDELRKREEALAQLQKIFRMSVQEKFSLAEDLAKDSGTAVGKLNFWLVVLRRALLGKLTLRISSKKALQSVEEIVKALETIKNTNASSRLVLENLFLFF